MSKKLFCDRFEDAVLRETYEKMDTNKDGKVDESDFSEIMRRSGQISADKASREAICRIDDESKDSSQLSFESFKTMLNQQDEATVEDCAEEVFKRFDVDGSGEIGPDNIVAMFKKEGQKLSVKDAEQIIKIIGGGKSLDMAQFKEIASLEKS